MIDSRIFNSLVIFWQYLTFLTLWNIFDSIFDFGTVLVQFDVLIHLDIRLG